MQQSPTIYCCCQAINLAPNIHPLATYRRYSQSTGIFVCYSTKEVNSSLPKPPLIFNGGLVNLGLILWCNKSLEYASGNIIPGKGIDEVVEHSEHQNFLPVESNYRVYSYIKVTSLLTTVPVFVHRSGMFLSSGLPSEWWMGPFVSNSHSQLRTMYRYVSGFTIACGIWCHELNYLLPL